MMTLDEDGLWGWNGLVVVRNGGAAFAAGWMDLWPDGNEDCDGNDVDHVEGDAEMSRCMLATVRSREGRVVE